MNFENLDAFVLPRQVDKKYLVEASLANHFGGEQVDPVGGGGHEQPVGLLLHPGEKERENPTLFPAGIGGRDPRLDLVEPKNRGRHILHHAARFHECAFGLAMSAGEDLDHVDAIERDIERGRDGFHREALAAARDPHEEDSLGHDLVGQGVAHLKQLAALQQPFLELLETADLPDGGALRDILDHAAAAHQEAFFFQ